MDKRTPSQKLKPLVVHREHWNLLSEYLAVEKDRLVTLLINCDEKDLKDIQGAIKALTRILDIPDNLKSEEKTIHRKQR